MLRRSLSSPVQVRVDGDGDGDANQGAEDVDGANHATKPDADAAKDNIFSYNIKWCVENAKRDVDVKV